MLRMPRNLDSWHYAVKLIDQENNIRSFGRSRRTSDAYSKPDIRRRQSRGLK